MQVDTIRKSNKRRYSSIDSDNCDTIDNVFSLNKIQKTLANTCPNSSPNFEDKDLNFFKSKVKAMTDKIDEMNFKIDQVNTKIDKLTNVFNRLYEVSTGEKQTINSQEDYTYII